MSDIAARSGFEDYELEKDYGPNKAGAVIQVDRARREWLDQNGYGKRLGKVRPEIPEPPPAPTLRPRSPKNHPVTVSDADINRRFPVTEILTPPFEAEG